jgi:hypothetical protein
MYLSSIKKIIFLLLPLLPAILSAQSIPDANFENWKDVAYNFPTGMTTSGSVTQLNPGYAGNYSIKVQGTPDGLQPGIFGYGKWQAGIFSGGIPFADRPDSVSGYYASHISRFDTAWVIVLLKKGGTVMGSDSFPITQTNTAYYSYFKSPIHYKSIAVPDTLLFLVFSTCPNHINDSSYLLMDNLSFVHSTLPLPNGDLESWYKRSYHDPTGWTTQNSAGVSAGLYAVSDTTDHFAGNNSCRLTNFNEGTYSLNGIAWIGKMKNGLLKPGFPIYLQDSFLVGYYKFIPSNGDSCTFLAKVFRHDSLVGSGVIYLKDTAINWTPFVVPITYISSFTGTPDSAAILMAAYKWTSPSSNARGHSLLEVDELSFNAFVTGIPAENSYSNKFNVFPNPFTETTQIQFELPEADWVTIYVFDRIGHQVKSLAKTFMNSGSHTITLDTEQLSSGVYFLTLLSGNQIQTRPVVLLPQ